MLIVSTSSASCGTDLLAVLPEHVRRGLSNANRFGSRAQQEEAPTSAPVPAQRSSFPSFGSELPTSVPFQNRSSQPLPSFIARLLETRCASRGFRTSKRYC